MKIQVADYVAQFLMEKGITDLFSVVGGGSMFLNDAFGRAKGIRCIAPWRQKLILSIKTKWRLSA